ncbi:TetR/AcrR family transcriptional regulator [Sabulicella rubraurantiaca]|uniref:TetR/AcrR family transcriptional regulator n=1 Tax=Sabulicella rubraurantiaca TaxID=2811429 RepID=UPI001A9751E2|nr:TetR/AcrR family transcriptional regulator [Sabulicella rubraurantiaca]
MPRTARTTAAKTTKPAGRSRRQEKAEQVRLALFDAAARIVGKHGYAGASVARITALAGVAQGTFYNYFASRQDLLDQLLPAMGEEMLAHIAGTVRGERDEVAREERRFRAFFAFLQKRPAFLRILNEAEVYAPKGFRAHLANIAADYRRALEAARGRGALPGFAEDEIEPLVFLLMAARSYTSVRYAEGPGGKVKAPPESLIRAYVKLMRHGIASGAAEE